MEKHRLRTLGPKDDASVGVGAGGGGGETLPLVHHPAVFSFTAPPLKKGRNWGCPTRDEEETLNLNPGNVYSFGGLEATSGVREESFSGKGASPSCLGLWVGLYLPCSFSS